jgi:hypothetical protein
MRWLMNEFKVRIQGKYADSQWSYDEEVFSNKTDAERHCFHLVHSAKHRAAIVVEMQPVVVSRVERNTYGVSMDYPMKLMAGDYE